MRSFQPSLSLNLSHTVIQLLEKYKALCLVCVRIAYLFLTFYVLICENCEYLVDLAIHCSFSLRVQFSKESEMNKQPRRQGTPREEEQAKISASSKQSRKGSTERELSSLTSSSHKTYTLYSLHSTIHFFPFYIDSTCIFFFILLLFYYFTLHIIT